MTQTAGIAYLGKAGAAPPELQGFINFRAGMEHRELKGDELAAVLRIGSTDCYHVLFLCEKASLAAVEKELAGIEARLQPESRARLKQALKKIDRKGC